jgi:hypothetical protein
MSLSAREARGIDTPCEFETQTLYSHPILLCEIVNHVTS